jgi:Na+/melibiose symporter-like transporter
MNTVIGLITVLTPKTDKMYLYRFLLPKMNFLGKPVGGEVLLFVKNSVAGTLGTILQPFALQAIRMVGGELNMLRLNSAIEAVTNLLKFLVGYNTFGKFAFMIAMDMIFDITNKWKPVAEKVIDYQMLDYVEWRTGLRSEGMTMAVGGFLTKLLKDNVGKVFSNAVEQWTGYLGYDIPVEQQPARFIDTIWPLLHIGAIFSSTLYFIGRAVFKYPADRAQVEADLIARRALAAAAKEEAKLVE